MNDDVFTRSWPGRTLRNLVIWKPMNQAVVWCQDRQMFRRERARGKMHDGTRVEQQPHRNPGGHSSAASGSHGS